MKDETELWWSPGQINYSRQQMTEFILPNWDLFKDGIYPPRYTSYVGREQGSQKADYVDAKEIYAEVSIRLAQCPDGEMVLDRYFRDQSWGTLARNYHFPFDEDIKKLAEIGKRIEAHYGKPQDIEWAIDSQNKIWILQSRPITTL